MAVIVKKKKKEEKQIEEVPQEETKSEDFVYVVKVISTTGVNSMFVTTNLAVLNEVFQHLEESGESVFTIEIAKMKVVA